MDHIGIMELTYVVMLLITVLTGGLMGIQVMKTRVLDKNVVKSRYALYEDQIKEHKRDVQRWRGKVGKNFQDMQVEGDYDLTSNSDIGQLAKMVLPNLLAFLPPDIAGKAKGLLDNPEIIEMGLKLYEKHPEDVKLLLSKFIKKGSGSKGISSNTPGLNTQDETTFA